MIESTRIWRGIQLGGASPFKIEEESGLDDIIVRSATRTVPRGDGGIPGPHFEDTKTIVTNLWVSGDTPAQAEERAATLRAVMKPTQDTHSYRLRHAGDVEKFVRARVLRLSSTRSVWTERLAVVSMVAVWEVADPRVYGTVPESLTLAAFDGVRVGFNLPEDLPFNMSPAPRSVNEAVHSGSGLAYPVIQVQYPVSSSGSHTGFTLTNLSTGVSIESDATLTVGQTLTVDMDARVRYTGDLVFSVDGSSRIGSWVRPRFDFFLQPGSNVLKFEPVGTAVMAVRLTWLPTY